jgi:hypothetical protein
MPDDAIDPQLQKLFDLGAEYGVLRTRNVISQWCVANHFPHLALIILHMDIPLCPSTSTPSSASKTSASAS